MKILNLHGFMGEADNKNYKALCSFISPDDIISPKLYYKQTSPEELIRELSEIPTDDELIYVGQSLGGWYADRLSRLFRRPCILTNPCYYPHELGLITDSGIPGSFIEQYKAKSADSRNDLAYTLCSDADTVLPRNRAVCEELSRHVTDVHGSHSTIENIGEYLAKMIAELRGE